MWRNTHSTRDGVCVCVSVCARHRWMDIYAVQEEKPEPWKVGVQRMNYV